MRVLATYNLKGGVGKTTSAVNLAWLAARDGARTLVWDLDPQGAATFYFRIKAKVKGGGAGLVHGRRELGAVIRGTDFEGLDLVPADLSYRNLDLVLDGTRKPRKQLRRLLRTLQGEYDWVFLDCPPAISLVSEAIFAASDVLLVPTLPSTLAVRTLAQTRAFCREVEGAEHATLLPFFTMVDGRKRLHKEVVAELPRSFPELLEARIPNASTIEQMGIHRAPVGAFAPESASARAYEALWREILERLDQAGVTR